MPSLMKGVKFDTVMMTILIMVIYGRPGRSSKYQTLLLVFLDIVVQSIVTQVNNDCIV
jgi:hypothetical protein